MPQEAITTEEMRAAETAAIATGRVSGLQLMERAGQAVVDSIRAEWPELEVNPPQVWVLCGPGNNGGDGFVVARLLRDLGWPVLVYLYGKPEKLPPDAKVNYQRWGATESVHDWDDAGIRSAYEQDETKQYLIVDALFGIGVSRDMPEDTEQMWRGFMPAALSENAHVPGKDRFVAIDLPSGLCGDTGHNYGALPAHLTVTFHRLKHGHLNGAGPSVCGKVIVKDIGL